MAVHRETLLREQRYLRRRVELLSNQMDAIHKRRSVSECSATSTGSSTGSTGSSESGRMMIQGCQMAKFHPFLSLGLRQGGGRGGAIQGKEGIKFCHLATLDHHPT